MGVFSLKFSIQNIPHNPAEPREQRFELGFLHSAFDAGSLALAAGCVSQEGEKGIDKDKEWEAEEVGCVKFFFFFREKGHLPYVICFSTRFIYLFFGSTQPMCFAADSARGQDKSSSRRKPSFKADIWRNNKATADLNDLEKSNVWGPCLIINFAQMATTKSE